MCKRLTNAFPEYAPTEIRRKLSEVDVKNPHVLINLYEDLQGKNSENLLDAIVNACIKLQGNRIFRDKSTKEDDRNTFISDMLESSGFVTKDQTRWSTSYKGKSSGEVDIFVRQKSQKPLAIIEALNLDSLKSDYLSTHLEKIFYYDTTGLKHNFIIVYYLASNFFDFGNKYRDFISSFDYPYVLESYSHSPNYDFTDITVSNTEHLRNGKLVDLYHILVNLKPLS